MPGLFGSSGGSGSTDGAPVNIPITAKAPPWAANMHDTMAPVDMPGNNQLLARDLAAGGFGPATGIEDWMKTFYHPAPTAYYAPPVAPTAGPKPKVVPKVPLTPTTNPSRVTGKQGYGVRRDGDKTIYERSSGHR